MKESRHFVGWSCEPWWVNTNGTNLWLFEKSPVKLKQLKTSWWVSKISFSLPWNLVGNDLIWGIFFEMGWNLLHFTRNSQVPWSQRLALLWNGNLLCCSWRCRLLWPWIQWQSPERHGRRRFAVDPFPSVEGKRSLQKKSWFPWWSLKTRGDNPTYTYLGGGNSNIFYFHPYLGKMNPFWLRFFRWVVQPPTSYSMMVIFCVCPSRIPEVVCHHPKMYFHPGGSWEEGPRPMRIPNRCCLSMFVRTNNRMSLSNMEWEQQVFACKHLHGWMMSFHTCIEMDWRPNFFNITFIETYRLVEKSRVEISAIHKLIQLGDF